jgi:eukaryotic-like serine/threonine-protein kinase
MSDARDNPLVGKVIGARFRLDAVIGTGAMGTVYRAKHLTLERHVAVKVLHAHLRSDDAFVTRFHREARAASRLDHANIMRVIDYGEDESSDEITKGRLFIAMELLDGTDLFQIIQDSFPLKRERVINIMRQLLAAVAAAHDAGIIHRDLKPENVMVKKRRDDDGEEIDVVKVCDFGIAKMTERSETSYDDGRKLSVHGLLVGTPEYMSPEQARGEALDARSDVYSVGVMLYQLIVGRLPFEGSQPLDVALKQLADMPVPPHQRAENVDPLLESICLKALSKPPEERFQSAREMRNALRAALDGKSASEVSGAYASILPPPAGDSDAAAMPLPSDSDATRSEARGIDTPLGTEREARRESDVPLFAATRKPTPLLVPALGAAAAAAIGYFALQSSATKPSAEPPRQAVLVPAPSGTPVPSAPVTPTTTAWSTSTKAALHGTASPSVVAPASVTMMAPGAAAPKPYAAPRWSPRAKPSSSGIERDFPAETAPTVAPTSTAVPSATAVQIPQPMQNGPDEH